MNTLYDAVFREVESTLGRVWLTNLANVSAILNENLSDINWVGFYLLEEKELILGPFQGKPACLYIPLGKGVCGTAAAIKKAIVVPDVAQFPGHISCDSRSRSEIVIPVLLNERVLGVLDIDSPSLGRFDADDEKGLTRIVNLLVEQTKWPSKLI